MKNPAELAGGCLGVKENSDFIEWLIIFTESSRVVFTLILPDGSVCFPTRGLLLPTLHREQNYS